ncbi:MAG: acylphosphatase [Desulfobacterales bacterium]|nr:acylphosphatase [Desulfobacterales bacterium]
MRSVFEGEKERVDAVLDWCRMGPAHAKVTDIKVTWQEYTGEFRGFEVSF